MYVKERFKLRPAIRAALHAIDPQFGYNGFGEYVYYSKYSRRILDDEGNSIGQEKWGDTVCRVVEGTLSIRKEHYARNRILWDDHYWQEYALRFGRSLARMEWLPPGRGLWAMGSPAVYERGAMPLYNCAYTTVGTQYGWVDDLCWIMDSLMNGVGVGFGVNPDCEMELVEPGRSGVYHIPDTREGWVESLRLILEAFQGYHDLPEFDVSLIRPKGSYIKTFGGIASGPAPLQQLHEKVIELCTRYVNDYMYEKSAFQCDLVNLIGVCVVSGNVRRSAEIALASFDDDVFRGLKDYVKNEYRENWGWMSNNSVRLIEDRHFEDMDILALANTMGHDLGYLNMQTFPLGRLGKDDGLKWDEAVGINPCGEIPLEDREVCNLSETLPTRCVDAERWYEACEFACFYSSTVALLPTHQPATNAVVNRNRRIGIGIIDFTGWKHDEGVAKVTKYLREGYRRIRAENTRLASEAGVPESIRVTTIKPGGTVPKLPGKTSGVGHPTFRHTLRRVRAGLHEPAAQVMLAAGVPHEPEHYDPKNTICFEFPIEQGPAKPSTEVSVWEQAMNVVLLQREWADNAVSNTIYFQPKWVEEKRTYEKPEGHHWDLLQQGLDKCPDQRYFSLVHVEDGPKWQYWHDRKTSQWRLYQYNPNHEEDMLEAVLAAVAPVTKSISLLPHSMKGIFPQMPEEGITQEEYEKRLAAMPRIDWSVFVGDGQDEKFCSGPSCELPV